MSEYLPSRDIFKTFCGQGNIVPVYKEMLADLETPVSAYLKTACGPYSFLLESVEGGERIGRYSYIGSEPKTIMTLKAGQGRVTYLDSGDQETFPVIDPLEIIRDYLGKYRPVALPGFLPKLPRFCGGAVGYLGYECASYFERIPVVENDDLGTPDAVIMFCDTVLVFDHVKHTIQVVTYAGLEGDPDKEYDEAIKRLECLIKRLKAPLPHAGNNCLGGSVRIDPQSNQTPQEFMAAVRKVKEYISAGDCIQVVPSQRLAVSVSSHPFDIYRALRHINPSPYMFYLDLGDFHLAGASPEMLVRVEDGVVRTRPLAGTRPRGKTCKEDQKIGEELLADQKECAEHVMLVDLARNDLGRVCKPGTVKVNTLMDVEKYSHVMHMVSDVTGVLNDDLTALDALRATFPAGTLSGAPKIRAMEIIAEVEPTQRGPYGGAVGYFDYSGNLDTAITIRTMLIKDKKAYVQAGAGIVADSDPVLEHRECMNKAAALLKALDFAGNSKEQQEGGADLVGGN